MFKPGIYQGRFLGEAEIAQVRGLIAGHPQWRRRRISEELVRLWEWRNPAGQFKDMAARTLLLKLAASCFTKDGLEEEVFEEAHPLYRRIILKGRANHPRRQPGQSHKPPRPP